MLVTITESWAIKEKLLQEGQKKIRQVNKSGNSKLLSDKKEEYDNERRSLGAFDIWDITLLNCHSQWSLPVSGKG